MSCNLTENISLLIDGALSSQEAAQARSHIAVCPECRKAMDEFLGLREALKGYALQTDDVSQRRALNTILSSESASMWKRRLSVPAPAMALLVISLIALGAWSFGTRVPVTRVREPASPAASGRQADGAAHGEHSSTEIGMELSRLDHGGRAVIIKVRKGQSARGQELERTRQ